MIINSGGLISAFAGVNLYTGPDSTDDEVFLVEHNSTSSFIYRNGLLFTGDSGTRSWGGIILAANTVYGSKLDGRIYGYIGVSRALTTAEIEATESYLATKSGVTLP